MFRKLLLLSFIVIVAPSYTVNTTIKDVVENNINFIFDNFPPNILCDSKNINRSSDVMAILATNPKADVFIDHATDNANKIVALSSKEKQQLDVLAKKYRSYFADKTIEKIKEKIGQRNYNIKANRLNSLASKFMVIFEQSSSSIIPIDSAAKKGTKDGIERSIDFIFKIFFIAPAFKEGMADIKDSIIKNRVDQVSDAVAILVANSRMDSCIDDELNKFITRSSTPSPEERLRHAISSEECGFQLASKTMEKIEKKLSQQDYNVKHDRIIILINTFLNCYLDLATQIID